MDSNKAGLIAVFILSLGGYLFLLGKSSTSTSTVSLSGIVVEGKEEQVVEAMNAFRAVFVTVPNIEVGKKLAQ
jgi:uncharacterized protein YkwD